VTEPRPGYLLSPKATILALLAWPERRVESPIVPVSLFRLIPETPLRRSVREPEATPVAA
jgi:hypothetical protein